MTLHALLNMPFLAINPVIEPIGRVGLNKAQLSQLQKKPKRPIYKEAIFSKWDCQDALQSQGWASCQTGFSLTLSVALKYECCNKSFWKDELLTSWTLFSTYLSSKLDSPLIKTLERENLILMINMLKKVFNWSEVHLSEMTCYKIHTLAF